MSVAVVAHPGPHDAMGKLMAKGYPHGVIALACDARSHYVADARDGRLTIDIRLAPDLWDIAALVGMVCTGRHGEWRWTAPRRMP